MPSRSFFLDGLMSDPVYETFTNSWYCNVLGYYRQLRNLHRMNNTIVLCAIPQEVEGLFYTEIFFSGVGKSHALPNRKIIQEHKTRPIINYGTAGSLDPSIKGLVKVTGFVDRDMDATSLNFKLGQTPMKKISLGIPSCMRNRRYVCYCLAQKLIAILLTWKHTQ